MIYFHFIYSIKDLVSLQRGQLMELTTVSLPRSLKPIAQDCSGIKDQGSTENYGIYDIQPLDDFESFEVVCDLETNGQEWIVFQRRFDGSEDFYLPWEDYKNGFGNLTGEHWLGLEKIHRLTENGVWQLRIDLEDFSNNTIYAEYSDFSIGDAATKYRLSIGNYSGDAGDALTYHANMSFSTYDEDNDGTSVSNCVESFKGAGWNNACYKANLNGLYFKSRILHSHGIKWNTYSPDYVLKKSEMKMRRVRWVTINFSFLCKYCIIFTWLYEYSLFYCTVVCMASVCWQKSCTHKGLMKIRWRFDADKMRINF